jgi:hypothetical protein
LTPIGAGRRRRRGAQPSGENDPSMIDSGTFVIRRSRLAL